LSNIPILNMSIDYRKVENCLPLVKMSNELVVEQIKHADTFDNFGVTNSHDKRHKLFSLMSAKSLTADAMSMVFSYATYVKSRRRIIREMEKPNAKFKDMAWFPTVLAFYKESTVELVKDETDSKFPVVNIPTCLPGASIRAMFLTTKRSVKDADGVFFTELTRNTAFSQLALSSTLQEKAKDGARYYWDKMVKVDSKAQIKGFQEGFYENSVGDSYYLILADGKEFKPKDAATGYTMEDLELYEKELRS